MIEWRGLWRPFFRHLKLWNPSSIGNFIQGPQTKQIQGIKNITYKQRLWTTLLAALRAAGLDQFWNNFNWYVFEGTVILSETYFCLKILGTSSFWKNYNHDVFLEIIFMCCSFIFNEILLRNIFNDIITKLIECLLKSSSQSIDVTFYIIFKRLICFTIL